MSDQGFLHAASMRARLASLERRLQHSPGDASRVAPECLRELEVAAARLEGLHENLRQRDAELRQLRGIVDSAEQRLGALVTMVDCGYLLTDLTGVIQEANPAASRILNISRKSLAGRPFVLFIASGRVELMGRLTILAEAGTPTDLELRLRPRERQMLNVRDPHLRGAGRQRQGGRTAVALDAGQCGHSTARERRARNDPRVAGGLIRLPRPQLYRRTCAAQNSANRDVSTGGLV